MSDAAGTAIRIVFPVEDDADQKAVARAAARTRSSVRLIFRNKEKYFDVFSDLVPEQAVAAFQGTRVVGVLLIKQDRCEPFRLRFDAFVQMWGPIKGAFLWYAYKAQQIVLDMPGTYCCAVWVHPALRGNGVGESLYRRIVEASSEPVSAMARTKRVAFHERCGFAPTSGLYYRLLGLIVGAVPMQTVLNVSVPIAPSHTEGEGRKHA